VILDSQFRAVGRPSVRAGDGGPLIMVDAVAVHPPTLADFQTCDPLVAQEFLDSAYGARLRMTTMKQL
jgi:hypothetical protein